MEPPPEQSQRLSVASAEHTVQKRLGERLHEALTSRTAVVIVLLVLFILLWWTAHIQEVTVERLLSLAVWGVMLGGIIALGGIGLSLVYGVLKFPNFSHGALLTVGAYAALALLPLFPQSAQLKPFSFGWEFLPVLFLAMPVAGLVALAADRVIYRPLRNRNAGLVLLAMASLGMMFFLRSIVYLIWGADFRFYYLARENPAFHLPLGVRVQADQFFILGLALVLVFFIYLLLEKTKMGKAMRATADNPDLARVSGIDTERVIAWTWIIGGALAGAGGVMLGLYAQLRPEMGFWMLLPMFAAVILGSIGNPYGALVGALIIGVAQQVSTAFLNPGYAPGVAFAIMILVLLLRPQGIFGKPGG